MSGLIPTGEAVLRELNKLEDIDPGAVISVPELERLMRREGIALPEDVSTPSFLEFLLRTGWVETDNNGFETVEQSFRISAKGQLRAAASVNYAEMFERASSSLPMLDEAGVEVKAMLDEVSGQAILGPSGGGIKPNDAISQTSSSEPEIRLHPVVESSKWTGTQFLLVDAKVIAEVRAGAQALHAAVYALHLASNSETEDLQRLADALVAICMMTEPDSTIIDRITASPKFKAAAGLIGLVAAIRGAIGF